ncbi:ATP-binding cassette domain-containing protein [Thalassotalea profundi]|uniref:Molybdenum import ATP-binding protein ModC n=1 Tax=Thalassotalea profundi TaxID=2036687 RepID=A0ABQ3J1T4_9GAMM|nr:ATP-binding cassette domain-containing protein [Thalassotalea profundi]GHE98461.1 molybdenum import ATP-binding protein ModC [Thalassotalea profundi]
MSLTIKLSHIIENKTQQGFMLDVEVSLPVNSHVVGVFGESGAGKSSLLKHIAGIGQAKQKKIHYNNDDITALLPENSPCCYQNQQGFLFPHLTVKENLLLILTHGNFSSAIPFSFDEVVNWCNLSTLLEQNVSTLSGGEIQRIAFARSLLSGKSLILLDEPFSALDWQAREKMLRMIPWLNSHYAIEFIIVSHSLRELSLVASYVVLLKQGKVLKQGLSNEIITRFSTEHGGENGQQAVTALRGKVVERLEKYQLLNVLLDGETEQTVTVHADKHMSEIAPSNSVLLSLNANKVSLSKTKPSMTSIVNLLEVKVAKIERFSSHALITLTLNEQLILAEISLMSLDKLTLAVDEQVYAQFKVL